MKRAISGLMISIAIASCATSGSTQLAACLADSVVMEQYRVSSAQMKVVVGGLDKERQVHCYWSEFRPMWTMANSSAAWKQCKEEVSGCAVVANGDHIVLNSN